MSQLHKYSRKWCSIVALGGLLSVTGCATTQKDIFYWGEYEDQIYGMYMEPGSADASTQISKLTTDIQRAEAEGKAIAPGVHAHLGYMYALQGNILQAKSELLIEKTLYPESAALIDGMMERIEGVKY